MAPYPDRPGHGRHLGRQARGLRRIDHGRAPAIAAPNFRRVATIGYTQAPGVGADGLLANPDGSISPIIHQYDRHAEAKAAIEARWITPDLASFAAQKPKGWAKTRARLRKSWARRWPDWR